MKTSGWKYGKEYVFVYACSIHARLYFSAADINKAVTDTFSSIHQQTILN